MTEQLVNSRRQEKVESLSLAHTVSFTSPAVSRQVAAGSALRRNVNSNEKTRTTKQKEREKKKRMKRTTRSQHKQQKCARVLSARGPVLLLFFFNLHQSSPVQVDGPLEQTTAIIRPFAASVKPCNSPCGHRANVNTTRTTTKIRRLRRGRKGNKSQRRMGERRRNTNK